MKILMVSSFLPHPLYSGGHIRLYNLIQQLSKKHEITLVCEMREYQTEEDIKEVQKICKHVIMVKRIKQWSLQNIIKTGFSRYAFLIIGHKHKEMQQKIKELIQNNTFDLIHCETSYVFQNIPVTRLPVVLVEHNIEYLVYKRFVDNAPIFAKHLLNLDVVKLKKIEESYWKEAKSVVAVSNLEKQIIEETGIKAEVVPNGVDMSIFKFRSPSFKFHEKEKRVLFIGDFVYLQNRDAARWIITEIWPQVRSTIQDSEFTNIVLWIVGRKIPNSIKNLATHPDIIFDENATGPTNEIFSKASVLLAPIRMGGGTQYKILEAMAVGTPVITTKLGTEGLEAKDECEVLIGKTANQLAEKVNEVLTRYDLYQTVATNARKLIEEKYSWEEIAKKLNNIYRSAI